MLIDTNICWKQKYIEPSFKDNVRAYTQKSAAPAFGGIRSMHNNLFVGISRNTGHRHCGEIWNGIDSFDLVELTNIFRISWNRILTINETIWKLYQFLLVVVQDGICQETAMLAYSIWLTHGHVSRIMMTNFHFGISLQEVFTGLSAHLSIIRYKVSLFMIPGCWILHLTILSMITMAVKDKAWFFELIIYISSIFD